MNIHSLSPLGSSKAIEELWDPLFKQIPSHQHHEKPLKIVQVQDTIRAECSELGQKLFDFLVMLEWVKPLKFYEIKDMDRRFKWDLKTFELKDGGVNLELYIEETDELVIDLIPDVLKPEHGFKNRLRVNNVYSSRAQMVCGVDIWGSEACGVVMRLEEESADLDGDWSSEGRYEVRVKAWVGADDLEKVQAMWMESLLADKAKYWLDDLGVELNASDPKVLVKLLTTIAESDSDVGRAWREFVLEKRLNLEQEKVEEKPRMRL